MVDTNFKYDYPDHIFQINEALVSMARGNLKRLMVYMPPRHGKSLLISQYYPAWYLGIHPDRRVILTTYESDFSAQWGYKARNILEQHKHNFNIEIDQNSKARNRWDLKDYGGGMATAGVGGPITGKGADLLIIDDPVKNAEEANSQTMRDKAWDWYNSTAYTRLEPNGCIILIMTRWHEDDLGGRLLERSDEDWTVLKLPAIDDNGKALWSERFPITRLEEIKTQIGSYWFSALYQQSPQPSSGGLFKRENFKPLNIPQAHPHKKVRFWDLAATTTGDYTAGLLLHSYNDDTYFIGDVQHIRDTPREVEKLILQTAANDGHEVLIRMEQEPGSSGLNTIDYYTRLLAGYNFKGIRSTGSKELRAGPVAAQVEAGNVYYQRGKHWNNSFLDEVSMFPHGRHDDITDALSGSFNELFAEEKRHVGFGAVG